MIASLVLLGLARPQIDASRSGMGWTMTRLDLEVVLENEPPAMWIEGTCQLRLDIGHSSGPTLVVNGGMAALHWGHLEAAGVGEPDVELDVPLLFGGGQRAAHVRFDEELQRGHVLTLSFELEWRNAASQLSVHPGFAIASWTDVWYPVALPLDYSAGLGTRLISIPGRTTLHLPPDWIALSDGELLERAREPAGAREVWSVEERPVARSFAAGPYAAAERVVAGRTMRVYLLAEQAIGVDRLAELLASSLAAQSARLGDFPFAGYGVAEVPEAAGTWYAASQQTFILAKSNAFAFEHGNLPLWSHEMGHAWWGNTVASGGPGEKVVGEALAQFGVLITLEAIEGRAAMTEFLEFSRSGYSANQCARGYFELLGRGQDHPLATLGDSTLDGETTHDLADSKGMWVWHMLRRRIGDETFFGVLRRLASERAGGSLSLDDLRAAFQTAAPAHGLERFFAQWLDRPGAPVIHVEHRALAEGRYEIELAQSDDRDPFRLDLALDVRLEDGTVRRERVAAVERLTRIERVFASPIQEVILDPERDVLLWRPAYGDVAAPTARR